MSLKTNEEIKDLFWNVIELLEPQKSTDIQIPAARELYLHFNSKELMFGMLLDSLSHIDLNQITTYRKEIENLNNTIKTMQKDLDYYSNLQLNDQWINEVRKNVAQLNRLVFDQQLPSLSPQISQLPATTLVQNRSSAGDDLKMGPSGALPVFLSGSQNPSYIANSLANTNPNNQIPSNGFGGSNIFTGNGNNTLQNSQRFTTGNLARSTVDGFYTVLASHNPRNDISGPLVAFNNRDREPQTRSNFSLINTKPETEDDDEDLGFNDKISEDSVFNETYRKHLYADIEKAIQFYYVPDWRNIKKVEVTTLNEKFLYLHHIEFDYLSTWSKPRKTRYSLGKVYKQGLKGSERNTYTLAENLTVNARKAIAKAKKLCQTEEANEIVLENPLPYIMMGRQGEMKVLDLTVQPTDVVIWHPKDGTSRIHAGIFNFDTVIDYKSNWVDKGDLGEEGLIKKEVLDLEPPMVLVDFCGDKTGALIKPKSKIFKLQAGMLLEHPITRNVIEVVSCTNTTIHLLINNEHKEKRVYPEKPPKKDPSAKGVKGVEDEDVTGVEFIIPKKDAMGLELRYEDDMSPSDEPPIAAISYSNGEFTIVNDESQSAFNGLWVRTKNQTSMNIGTPYFFKTGDLLLMCNHLFCINDESHLPWSIDV
jgi:hypothetical protein